MMKILIQPHFYSSFLFNPEGQKNIVSNLSSRHKNEICRTDFNLFTLVKLHKLDGQSDPYNAHQLDTA